MMKRPRLLVFNQYYWPGVEATAHLLSELCEALADDFEITVVTGTVRGEAKVSERIVRNGVRIVRVPSTAFDRRRLLLRAVNYMTFLASSLTVGLRLERPDVVLCMTDPPIIANVALPVARRFRVPLVVVSQDVFPEIAVQLGRLEQPVVVGALRHMISFYLRRADQIVAIGETMRERLEAKGAPAKRISFIPNWVDTQSISPAAGDNFWARSNELDSSFVVLHSS
jgi:colanic acid biosynthesis glycosyl transferase WcaI